MPILRKHQNERQMKRSEKRKMSSGRAKTAMVKRQEK